MKKTKILLCALCVVLTLALCACGGGTKLYNITEENAWWTFPVEESPVKTVNAGENGIRFSEHTSEMNFRFP